ncbi:MAG: acyltransferase [bacterium]
MNFIQRVSRRGPCFLIPFELIVAAVRGIRNALSVFRCVFYGIKIAKNVHIGPGLRFNYPWNIEIKDNCTIEHAVRFWCECDNNDAKLTLEPNVHIGRDSSIDFTGGLIIGEGTLFSEGVIIHTHDHGYDPRSIPDPHLLTIGKNTWIGVRAIILPTVQRIGNRVIVGAGAVVSKDIPDDMIYVSQTGRTFSKKEKIKK